MTNKTCTYEEWVNELSRVAYLQGSDSPDREAWRYHYDDGRTPTEAWMEELSNV